ncbi:MAG TPA: DNA (cytosine-5-)-methyltransferase [Saprospiraceae bacterium]|jgi:DNA (cytosine-5)-methyltransferase 1|nr:DNA (cytosine-5-)-methyltransferase [Saprospiraceae bacterium]HMT76094.1 DNA (cytosine-5-)-methyltransferase [Saprospiraceae bacterium]
MENKIKVASFFCGCGGSDLGILGDFKFLKEHYAPLPFEISYALDFDKYAVETYNANFEHPAVCDNIKNVDINQIEEFDLLLGGFPCQSFSTVNPNKDTNDDRANLYKELVKILKAKQPKFFICENVKGLVTLQKGEILKKVVTEFESVGYKVKYRVLLASNFGIPQKRERVFIIGVRNDINVGFKFPAETHSETNLFSTKKWVPLKKVIPQLAIEDKKYYFSQRAVEGMKNAKNNMKRGLYQDLEGQCLTITSHLAKTSLNSRDPVLLVNPEKEIYRRFTPEEAASIQSFPENFVFPVSETQAYRQIGNAIPPVLMWHVANALAENLNTMSKSIQVNELQEFF